jgi:glycerate kinase
LGALKQAILEGATWRYEHLVDVAVVAGATDEDIDAVAHEALHALFACAEQPVTPRQLAHAWGASHFRR